MRVWHNIQILWLLVEVVEGLRSLSGTVVNFEPVRSGPPHPGPPDSVRDSVGVVMG